MGHVLMENRHGLVVEAELTRAAGFAERRAAVELVAARAGGGPLTVGADRACDAADFVMELRELGAAPHVAQNNARRRSAIDRRATRHAGYRLSQRARHRIEEVFAWVKTIAGQSKTKHRGLDRVRWHFTLATAAYNLIRLPKLLGAAPRPARAPPAPPGSPGHKAPPGHARAALAHTSRCRSDRQTVQFFSSLLEVGAGSGRRVSKLREPLVSRISARPMPP
jgi:hypothetical protein